MNAARAEELRRVLRHRDVGAVLLSGHGLEIGALHYPFPAPRARASRARTVAKTVSPGR